MIHRRRQPTMPAVVSAFGRLQRRWGILVMLLLAFSPLSAAAVFAAPVATPAAAAGAFTGPDDPGMPALIASLRGCLGKLPAADQNTLSLRAGLDGHAPRLTAEVAAALKRSPAEVAAGELGAIRKLESQRRRGACQVQPAQARPSRPAAKTAASTKSTSPPAGSSAGVLDVALPVLLASAFIVGISREVRRRPGG